MGAAGSRAHSEDGVSFRDQHGSHLYDGYDNSVLSSVASRLRYHDRQFAHGQSGKSDHEGARNTSNHTFNEITKAERNAILSRSNFLILFFSRLQVVM